MRSGVSGSTTRRGAEVSDTAQNAALAIDLGGTKVDAAIVLADGTLLAETRHRAPTGSASTLEQIVASIRSVVTAALAASPVPIVGVGIGSAGPISLTAGSIAPVNLRQLHGFGLVDFVRSLAGDMPITLRLDGTCIALAEHWLGANRGIADCMAMIVSTGVGGGIVSGGRLLAGASGNAGHIGQMQIARFDVSIDGQPQMQPPAPDARGAAESVDVAAGASATLAPTRRDTHTLESLAAGPRTVEWARGQGWKGTTGEELGRDYRLGVDVAQSAVRRSARALGEGIASASTLLDLRQVAIGGGFSRVSHDYIELVAESVQRSAVLPYAAAVTVVASGLGDDGPLIGAAGLIHRGELLAH